MYTRLCRINDLAVGEPKSFKIKGREIFAVNLDGRFCCLDARCTHAGAPLAEGEIQGEVLTCPWHYSQFNVTSGKVLRGPAMKSLKTYKTENKDNFLYIDL